MPEGEFGGLQIEDLFTEVKEDMQRVQAREQDWTPFLAQLLLKSTAD